MNVVAEVVSMDKVPILIWSSEFCGIRYEILDPIVARLKRETGLSEEEVFMNLMEPELQHEVNKEWLAEDVCTFWVGAFGTVLIVPFYQWEDAIEEVAVGKTPSE